MTLCESTRNTKAYPVFRHRKRKAFEGIKDSFNIFNIFLWIHSTGYTYTFRSSASYFIISIILSIINEGVTVIWLIGKISIMYYEFDRNVALSTVVEMGEFYLRILFSLNRRKINKIADILAERYSIQVKNRLLSFKTKLVLILLINDSFKLLQILMYYTTMSKSDFEISTKFLFPPHPYLSKLFSVLDSLHYFNMLSNIFSIYFCCTCFVLKQILLEFKNSLLQDSIRPMCHLFQEYNEILSLISRLNKTFHNMLFTSLTINLIWIFWGCYKLGFEILALPHRIALVMLLIYASLLFPSICIFASSVEKVVNDINDIIHSLSFTMEKDINLPILLKANRRFDGFTLFDIIVINKGLILTAMGNLLSYGVLIATFRAST